MEGWNGLVAGRGAVWAGERSGQAPLLYLVGINQVLPCPRLAFSFPACLARPQRETGVAMATSEEPISLVMSVVQRLAWSSKLPARGFLCCPRFLSMPQSVPRVRSSGTLLSLPWSRLCLPAGGWLRFHSLGILWVAVSFCPMSEVGSADPGSLTLRHTYNFCCAQYPISPFCTPRIPDIWEGTRAQESGFNPSCLTLVSTLPL